MQFTTDNTLPVIDYVQDFACVKDQKSINYSSVLPTFHIEYVNHLRKIIQFRPYL